MTRYCLKGDNPHQNLCFVLICPGDRHFDVESSFILQKEEMPEVFVGFVQIQVVLSGQLLTV